MNLDELLQKMASDAIKENEQLKSEVNLLRERLHDSENYCEEFKKLITRDCQWLANHCFVLTQGSMCCFCELNEFKCPHAMSYEQKIKAAMKFMEE
jgi:hypothetical protein